MISILILTKNEERDLPGCLQSVSWSDDIHVFDTGSTDRTVDIARGAGATVTVREYADNSKLFGGDEAAHRNWGLRNIAFKYGWVMMLDADERASPALVRSAQQAVSTPGEFSAFRIERRDYFLGTWLAHVQTTAYYLRLFRPDKLRYERLINSISVVDGLTGDLDGHLDHYPFSKGVTHWFNRHNAYSSLEAEEIVANRGSLANAGLIDILRTKDFHDRRKKQKDLFYRLPFRPAIKFLLLYIMKRGFLDGQAGLSYAVLQSLYEYMIVIKVRELDISLRRR